MHPYIIFLLVPPNYAKSAFETPLPLKSGSPSTTLDPLKQGDPLKNVFLLVGSRPVRNQRLYAASTPCIWNLRKLLVAMTTRIQRI